MWCLLCFSAAVIKMEGGTDFDLQVLEVPTAPAATGGEASSGAATGEGEVKGPAVARENPSSQTSSELTGSRTESTSSGGTGETKGSKQVRVMSGCTRGL